MTSSGVCGKRAGYRDIFGSSSDTSAKRHKLSSYGSLTSQFREFGSGSDEAVSCMMQKFPALDPELIKTVLRDHNYEIDDAIESLRRISFQDASERTQNSESATVGNCDSTCIQLSEQDVDSVKTTSSYEYNYNKDGSKWVDLIVQQILSAADIDDARGRAATILESFERNLENASLKEHLRCLLNDNQILKRAVSIQHERSLEQEDKMKEMQSIKLALSQYQEQIRSLELKTYALKLNLQSWREGNSYMQFPPDIC